MNRRNLLKSLLLAPLAPLVGKIAPPPGPMVLQNRTYLTDETLFIGHGQRLVVESCTFDGGKLYIRTRKLA